MTRHATVMMIGLLGVFSYAQAVTCKKGVQCGNTCISASYTCHVGGPVVAPVSPPPAQVLTSPPIPAEPSGTYFGWSVIDNSSATVILNTRTTQVPLSIGYSKRLTGLTSQEARSKVDRVLADEIPTGVVVLGRIAGSGYQWLARRDDGSRGVLISIDSQGTGVTVQVSVYGASSAFDLPGFTGTTRAALLAQVSPVQTVQPVAAPAAAPTAGLLNLTFNPDNMFTDPASGNLIVTAQCLPFTLSLKPSQPFSKLTITETYNDRLFYSLDVMVDDKLKFTQDDSLSGGTALVVLLGQQQAGAAVLLIYKPKSTFSLCRGTLNFGFKVE